jgi:hypothetical protein
MRYKGRVRTLKELNTIRCLLSSGINDRHLSARDFLVHSIKQIQKRNEILTRMEVLRSLTHVCNTCIVACRSVARQ